MTAKTYQPDVPFTLELVGIDDQPLYNDDGSPMTIELLGADSDVAVDSRNKQQNRRLAAGARLKLTAEGLDADASTYLAKLTANWNITPSKLVPGIDPGLGEGIVAHSQGAAVKLYGEPKLSVIKDQVDKAIADRGNFLRASPTT